MVRFWGRGPNRNSAPRKRSLVCSFWPFDRHKKSSSDTYRVSDPSETHSKRSLRSSSKSHSKKRQGSVSDLIDTVVNTRDLSHLSFSRPPPRVTSAVREQLAKIDDWDFDIFDLSIKTAGRPLYTVCMAMMEKEGLLEPSWVINRQKAERFFVAVEATYKGTNHYHNSTHAADVAQAAMIILKAGPNSLNFTKLEVFSLICAAAVHDLGHPGFTNDFLINTQHANAITYNDRSVNENFHVSCAFRIVSQSEETNIFSGLTRAEYVVARRLIVNAVLATDMTQHMRLLDAFSQGYAQQPDLASWRDTDVLLQLVLHTADLCNPCRQIEFSIKWGELICKEFLEQGDAEAQRQLPVTPMCDRESVIVSTNQLRFIQYLLKPTLEVCRPILGTALLNVILGHLQETEARWSEHERRVRSGDSRVDPHLYMW
ncbi:hypothetical protein ABBQ38_015372 [Trebouxia sp. C0009 RCD-2024]